jgi:hypothetical protein
MMPVAQDKRNTYTASLNSAGKAVQLKSNRVTNDPPARRAMVREMSNLATAGRGFYAARRVAKIQVAEVAGDVRISDVCRVAKGGCPPKAPTDPDMPD